jgi:hypothetical protein
LSRPFQSWIKINTDEAAVNNHDNAATSGIFRADNAICTACFVQNLGPDNALFPELHTAMIAIEVTASKRLHPSLVRN